LAKPVVDRLERDLEGELAVLRLGVNSAVGRQLAARYGVRGVPAFFLFDGTGEVVYSQAGRLDSDRVKDIVQELRR
jgi:thioredoxin-related protein